MLSIQIDTLNCPPLQAVLNGVLYLLDTVRLLDNLLVCYRQNGSSRTSPAQSVLTLPEPSSMSEVLPGLGVSEVASIQNGKTKLCKEIKVDLPRQWMCKASVRFLHKHLLNQKCGAIIDKLKPTDFHRRYQHKTRIKEA